MCKQFVFLFYGKADRRKKYKASVCVSAFVRPCMPPPPHPEYIVYHSTYFHEARCDIGGRLHPYQLLPSNSSILTFEFGVRKVIIELACCAVGELLTFCLLLNKLLFLYSWEDCGYWPHSAAVYFELFGIC